MNLPIPNGNAADHPEAYRTAGLRVLDLAAAETDAVVKSALGDLAARLVLAAHGVAE